jgi:hypothetical protein
LTRLPTSPQRQRWPRILRTLLFACLLLFVGLFWLPVPLRIGGFELAAYARAEQPGSVSPKQGPTYLTATGFRGEKAGELIVRIRNRSFRIAWVIGG